MAALQATTSMAHSRTTAASAATSPCIGTARVAAVTASQPIALMRSSRLVRRRSSRTAYSAASHLVRSCSKAASNESWTG